MTSYAEKARTALREQAAEAEPDTELLHVEMLAMFLCDSHIISLGPSGDGERLSGGHGWHRARSDERTLYRQEAIRALAALSRRNIP